MPWVLVTIALNDVNISCARAKQNLLGLNPYARQVYPSVDPGLAFIVGYVIRYPYGGKSGLFAKYAILHRPGGR